MAFVCVAVCCCVLLKYATLKFGLRGECGGSYPVTTGRGGHHFDGFLSVLMRVLAKHLPQTSVADLSYTLQRANLALHVGHTP